jgi:hypothetical protein
MAGFSFDLGSLFQVRLTLQAPEDPRSVHQYRVDLNPDKYIGSFGRVYARNISATNS